jgi:acetyl esterase/lipase
MRVARPIFCALLFAFAHATTALADPPPEIAAQIREWGRGVEAWPRTRALYERLHRPHPETVLSERDIAYGPHAAQQIDVFRPAQASTERRRILLFVPGGGYTVAPRVIAGGPFYHNLGVWAAQNGMVAVLMSHRVLPDYPYPAAQEDIQAALNWIADNAERLGGDPTRVAVMGFSAGAIHLASFVAEGRFAGRVRPDRYAFISGQFDLPSAPSTSGQGYFGSDPEQRRARLSRAAFRERAEPLLIAYSEYDPESFVTQAESFRPYMCDAGRCPTVVRLDGHNHVSGIFSIGTEATSLSGPLLRFLQDR